MGPKLPREHDDGAGCVCDMADGCVGGRAGVLPGSHGSFSSEGRDVQLQPDQA